MKTVREVAAAVVLLQRDFEELKRSRYHCDICPEEYGCNAFPRTNGVADPIHTIHKA